MRFPGSEKCIWTSGGFSRQLREGACSQMRFPGPEKCICIFKAAPRRSIWTSRGFSRQLLEGACSQMRFPGPEKCIYTSCSFRSYARFRSWPRTMVLARMTARCVFRPGETHLDPVLFSRWQSYSGSSGSSGRRGNGGCSSSREHAPR